MICQGILLRIDSKLLTGLYLKEICKITKNQTEIPIFNFDSN